MVYPTRLPLLLFVAAVDIDCHARSCAKHYAMYRTKVLPAVTDTDLCGRSCAAPSVLPTLRTIRVRNYLTYTRPTPTLSTGLQSAFYTEGISAVAN